MFKNYIKLAFRNIKNSKLFSAINVAGLSIGLAASFLMLLIVYHETSYDKYNEKLDRIARVLTEKKDFEWIEAQTPFILAPEMKERFPEVEETARVYRMRIGVKYAEDKTDNVIGCSVDNEIFDILTIPILFGDKDNLLKTNNSIVLSERAAQLYFNEKEALGETLPVIVNGEEHPFKVTGIFKNLPETSTFRGDILVPINYCKKNIDKRWSFWEGTPSDDWAIEAVTTYVLLNNKENISTLKHNLEEFGKTLTEKAHISKYAIQPLEEVYLGSDNIINNRVPSGDKTKTTVYTIIALLLLFIACINFIILSTAKSIKRTREMGIRKVIGASRFLIMFQIISESIIISLISLPIAFILVELALPELSELLRIQISMDYFHNWQFYSGFILLTVIVGIFSGLYLAFFLSRLKPTEIFKYKLNSVKNGFQLRNGFVIIQLIVFVGLVFAAVVVHNQLEFFRTKDMGFDKENLLIIQTGEKDFEEKYRPIKNELSSLKGVISISAAQELPPQFGQGVFSIPKNNNPEDKIKFNGLSVDYDFIETMGMKLIDGRDFSKEFPTDVENAAILNETGLKLLELGDERIIKAFDKKIVGVVKDFNFRSLHNEITPLYISLAKDKYLNEVAVKISGPDILNTVKEIENKWNEFYPNSKMDYHFYEERIDALYREELNFAVVINLFTGLTIFVTCLGLFGLSLFIAQQRTKEISVRKVLGASTFKILILVSKEFIYLTITSTVIAIPIAYYFMQHWLNDFAYKVSISPVMIIISFILAIVITLSTVLYQGIKAALTNPAECLRYE